MKRAVSISIGSSKRDKSVEVELLGEKVLIERIGTDGSMEIAAQMYRDLDGKVDAFGVGGTDLGLTVDDRWYPLHSVKPMVRYVRQTPLVDGSGLKNTLERRVASFMSSKIDGQIKEKKVLVTTAVDRWGMAVSFDQAGYQMVLGDMMFSLGIGIPIHSLAGLKRLAAILIPVAGRLPFEWVYPTGEKQEERIPKWQKYYHWATVIAGDCHYIKRHIPDGLEGKVVVTNTTTPEDVELFRRIGIRYLVTTTPVLGGRSFGTNMMEAALVAISGKGRKLTDDEYEALIAQLGMEPQVQEL